MRKLCVAMLVAGASLTSLANTALAQRYLDDYRGHRINDVKDSLSRQGYREIGHITKRRGTYALMFDGRTCIGLHGARGVIDEIERFDSRDCDRRRDDRPRRDYDRPPRY